MRLGIKKTGCSGLAYTMELIESANDEDHIFPVGDNKMVVVASKHLPYLQGTKIDFIREGLNQHFTFHNPNEAQSCGCGESFSVKTG
jgi:iron-sulfur cluster assembly protein